MAPERAADYVAAFCPQLLDRLTMPVFNLLLGNISVDKVIEMVEEELGQ